MTEGRHYWEVEITNCSPDQLLIGAEQTNCGHMLIGAVRPGLDLNTYPWADNSTTYGGLWVCMTDSSYCIDMRGCLHGIVPAGGNMEYNNDELGAIPIGAHDEAWDLDEQGRLRLDERGQPRRLPSYPRTPLHKSAASLSSGDRIGCLLDLDAGLMRFYRNGVP